MANTEFTADELKNEQWKDIEGYDGVYQVSNLGRVRSIKVKILSTSNSRYPQVSLYKQPAKRGQRPTATPMVHRLVAQAFLGCKEDGLVINHIDGCKTNNRISNLEYCTPSENNIHAFQMGLAPAGDNHWARRLPEKLKRGEDVSWAKLAEEDIRQIRHLYKTTNKGYRSLGEMFGVSHNSIRQIIKGRSWAHVK
jgi:hypothetical protein